MMKCHIRVGSILEEERGDFADVIEGLSYQFSIDDETELPRVWSKETVQYLAAMTYTLFWSFSSLSTLKKAFYHDTPSTLTGL